MFVLFPVIYRVCFRRAWAIPMCQRAVFLRCASWFWGLVWHVCALPFDTRNALSPQRIAHTLHDKNAKFGRCFRLKPVQKTNFLPIGNTLIKVCDLGNTMQKYYILVIIQSIFDALLYFFALSILTSYTAQIWPNDRQKPTTATRSQPYHTKNILPDTAKCLLLAVCKHHAAKSNTTNNFLKSYLLPENHFLKSYF